MGIGFLVGMFFLFRWPLGLVMDLKEASYGLQILGAFVVGVAVFLLIGTLVELRQCCEDGWPRCQRSSCRYACNRSLSRQAEGEGTPYSYSLFQSRISLRSIYPYFQRETVPLTEGSGFIPVSASYQTMARDLPRR